MLYRRKKRKQSSEDDQFDLSDLLESNIYLFIVDCETRRFAVAGPVNSAVSSRWSQEIERAARTGRRIFCVAVSEIEKAEIEILGAVLGYQEWPPNTIVTLPSEGTIGDQVKERKIKTINEDAKAGYQLRARELSTLSRSSAQSSKGGRTNSPPKKKAR